MVPKQIAYKRKWLCALMMFTATFFYSNINAQTTALRLYNNFNINKLYIDSTAIHTAWKPVLYEDTITPSSSHSWLHRKFFEEHLLNVQQPGFTIYGDIVVDEYIGYDKRAIRARNGSGDNYH